MFYLSVLGSSTKVEMPEPAKNGVDYAVYNLTKSGRTADGTMTMDFIAKKHKFNFSYEVLSSVVFNPILAIIDDPANMFFTIYYPEVSGQKSGTFYVGEIDKTSWRKGSAWYWKDVKFDFIEK
jgi:hypothetical protein